MWGSPKFDLPMVSSPSTVDFVQLGYLLLVLVGVSLLGEEIS